MLKVSATAKEKLTEALQRKTGESEETFRVFLSSSEPRQFQLGLDRKRKGDQVVKNEDGTAVLLVGATLATQFQGWEIDYKKTPRGPGFTVSPIMNS